MPDFDLMTYGFPCKNISISGNLEGFERGSNTQSSLLWEAMRIAKKKKPKYMIAENVKNLVSKRYKKDFLKWLKYLEGLGYENYWEVLDAQDFNIPQSRQRVFVVSVRKDIDHSFEFPKGKKTDLVVGHFLNPRINDKYYLSDDALKYMNRKVKDERTHWDFGHHAWINKSSKTITANIYKGVPYGIVICAMRGRYDKKGDVKQQIEARKDNLSNVITTVQKDNLVFKIKKRKIRRLTPLECWRLMGFNDEDYWRARFALEEKYYYGNDRSDTRMYKMAGNSIVVPVLEAIFNKLF